MTLYVCPKSGEIMSAEAAAKIGTHGLTACATAAEAVEAQARALQAGMAARRAAEAVAR